MSILETIKQRAAALDRTIVLPESHDRRVLAAAGRVRQQGFARVILLGQPDQVAAEARTAGLSLADALILDPESPWPRAGPIVP